MDNLITNKWDNKYNNNIVPNKTLEIKKKKKKRNNGSFENKYRLIINTPFYSASIKSYGLMVFAKDTKRWIILQRKHSIYFLLIFKGFYRDTYLYFIISKITIDESKIIKKCIEEGPDTFKNIYLNDLGFELEGLSYALIRMAESHLTIINIINNIDISKNILEWTWPKGRPHFWDKNETYLECAKREFIEEVEIILPQPIYISNEYISHVSKKITGCYIESHYWIYIIPNEISLSTPKLHPEVSNRLWIDTESLTTMIPETLDYYDELKNNINYFL